MSKGLRVSLILVGFLFLVLGIGLNQIFYNSLAGENLTYQIAYSGIGIGIGLDISKVLALILGAFLIGTGIAGFVIAGFLALALYLCLASISLVAGWGFSLVVAENYEITKQQQNVQYQAAQSNLETATDRVNQLAEYASFNLVALETQAANELAKQVKNSSGVNAGSLASWTNNCTRTETYYYQYCDKYNQLQSQIQRTQQYQTALAQKELAQADFAQMGTQGGLSNVNMHPVFIGLASLGIFGNTPQLAKYRFLFASFFLVELIGAFFFAIGVIFKSKAVMTVQEMKLAMDNMQQTTKLYEQFKQQNLAFPAQNEAIPHPK